MMYHIVSNKFLQSIHVNTLCALIIHADLEHLKH